MSIIRLLSLNADDGVSLKTFGSGDLTPEYAILSHRWLRNNAEELTFEDVTGGRNYHGKPGYYKVYSCLQQAAKDGLRYCWIDTCCIDKGRSTELNSAITSMFRWYQKAVKCYAYLSDVSVDDSALDPHLRRDQWESQLRHSKWFTRGWTLQELLAPVKVEFFSNEWRFLGDRTSLLQVIHETAHISIEALERRKPLTEFSIKDRMSWAESRTTTEPEDMVYCLLGIFDVSIVPVYGEGIQKAYNRLQRAIEEQDASRPSKRRRISPSDHDANDEHAPCRPSLDDHQIKALKDSLSFGQIEARRLTIKEAHAKTCKWLLEDPQYLDWLDTQKQDDHNGFLWIKGKPGSGKSTIMKFALDRAQRISKGDTLLSFFFNARGTDLEKSVTGLYRTLLVQLLERVTSLEVIFQRVLGVRASRISSGYDWDINSLQALLVEAIYNLGGLSLTCFIDALDECGVEAEIRDMISFLNNLCQQSTTSTNSCIKICFASRHYPHISIPTGIELILDDKMGHKEDIAAYLSSELRIKHSKDAENIRLEVSRKASGIFIWIVLVVRMLNQAYDTGGERSLWQKLTEVPSDVHELFRDILKRDSKNVEGTKLCIQWILFAKEPLTVRQLCHAILSGREDLSSLSSIPLIAGTETESNDDDGDDDGDDFRFVLANSKGLAEKTRSKKDQRVQFIHESVKDFLLKGEGFKKIWSDHAGNTVGFSHERLKLCCLSFINTFNINSVRSVFGQRNHESTEPMFRDQLDKKLPFLRYATEGIMYHADQASKCGLKQINFLQSFHVDRWVELMDALQRYQSRKHPSDASLLYLLAEMDAPNLIREHPDALLYLRTENQRYRTPLFAALAKGNRASVLALLETHIDRRQLGSYPKRLLTQYSEDPGWQGKFKEGYRCSRISNLSDDIFDRLSRPLLEFLLEVRFSVASGNPFTDRTAFIAAAMFGRSQIVQEQIDAGECVDLTDERGNALSEAFRGGHLHTVRILLDRGADINNVNMYGHTRLYTASLQGDLEVVRLLQSQGAEINPGDLGNQNSLCAASLGGHSKVIQLLLDQGADVNSTDGSDRNSLYIASSKGHSEVVRILLDQGANINSGNQSNQSGLSAALDNKHFEIVRLLLSDRGTAVNLIDNTGRNILCEAAAAGYLEVVQLLLERGVDVDSTNSNGENSLFIASLKGHLEIVRLLLDHGANVNSTNKDRHKCIMAASEGGHFEVAQLLLDQGTDVNSVDQPRQNNFQTTSSNRYLDVIRLLLKQGADFNSISHTGRNVLCYVAAMGHLEVMQLLLESGVDVQSTNSNGENGLFIASSKGYLEMVRLLLDGGADVNSINQHDQSSLYTASLKGHLEIVRLLLDRGASVNIRHRFYGTALHAASGGGYVELVILLLEEGADVHATSEFWGSVLQAAMCVKVARVLKAHGAV